MQTCLSVVLNKHKKSSTAVLFVSILITFCVYPHLDDGSNMFQTSTELSSVTFKSKMICFNNFISKM